MGPQPGHKRQASRTIVLIPLPEQVGPTPTPPGPAGGFLLALSGCVKQKAWNGGLSKSGKEKGGVSLSHPPTASKAASFPRREKALPSKRVPTGYAEKRPLAWESQAASPARSGPVRFNSCTFMEGHKKGPASSCSWAGGGGHGGRLGWGSLEGQTLNLVSDNPFWV